MRLPHARFAIGQLMIVVAAFAVLSAWLRRAEAFAVTIAAVVVLVPPAISLSSLFLFARAGHRLLVATWVASFWPLSIVWTLHAAWVVAYGFLGHPPGPADNGVLIEFLATLVVCSVGLSMISTIICLCLAVPWTIELIEERRSWYARIVAFLLMPMAWFSVLIILAWDPLQAYWWVRD